MTECVSVEIPAIKSRVQMLNDSCVCWIPFIKPTQIHRSHSSVYHRRLTGQEELRQYLENGESKGMSQVLWRLEDLLPVVAVQIHAAQHVQLGVHPVQSSFDQVYQDHGMEQNRSGEHKGDDWASTEVDDGVTKQWKLKKRKINRCSNFISNDKEETKCWRTKQVNISGWSSVLISLHV